MMAGEVEFFMLYAGQRRDVVGRDEGGYSSSERIVENDLK